MAHTTRSEPFANPFLYPGARGLVHSGVVRLGGDARAAQGLGGARRALAGRRVDQGAPSPDEIRQQRAFLDLARDSAHVRKEIRPVETGDEDLGARKTEQLDDVLPDLRSGRGGERQDRRPALPFAAAAPTGRVGEQAVVGAEIVTPLRHAVRLVDGEARDRRLFEQPPEGGGREPLGCDVQEAQPALPHRRLRRAAGGHRGERMERGGRDSLAGQLVHLVLHQGDERRHDQSRSGQEHRGELVADRLARAGRHHGEQVPARERGAHDVLLAGAEGPVAEVAEERGPGVHGEHYSARPRRRPAPPRIAKVR